MKNFRTAAFFASVAGYNRHNVYNGKINKNKTQSNIFIKYLGKDWEKFINLPA